jgi:hypothetical protein
MEANMYDTKIARWSLALAVVVGGLPVAGAALAAPAMAVTEAADAAPPEATASGPKPPTEQARSAARAVKAYRDSTPYPEYPGVDATGSARTDYEQASLRWMQEFPYEAGMAQWNCVGTIWEHELRPSADGGPDYVATAWGFGCPDGWFPKFGQIFEPRPDAIEGPGDAAALGGTPIDAARSVDPAEVASSSVPPESNCLLIRDGQHCFEHAANTPTGKTLWFATYYWWGAGTMTGRYRVGSVAPVWPACSEGSPIDAGAITTLQPKNGVGYVFDPQPGTVKSLIWDEADSSGNITGVRSVRCELEPEVGAVDVR